MSFISEIKELQSETCGVIVRVADNDTAFLFGPRWQERNKPVVGDYLTQCNDGYYSVCPKHAFNAIKQVQSNEL